MFAFFRLFFVFSRIVIVEVFDVLQIYRVQTGHGAEFGASNLAEGPSPAPPATSQDASLDLRRGPAAGHFIKTIETHAIHFYTAS